MTDQIPDKQETIEAVLNQPVVARLGTARDNQPHVVPVWFYWDGESLWISSFSSTRKVKELDANPRCSVLIEPVDGSGSKLQAVLLEGAAELIREPRSLVKEMSTRIYTRYMGPEGVMAAEPQSWISDPENTLVRLKPRKTYSW